MIEPMTESENSLQNEKDKNIALLVYLLLGLGFLTGGLTAVAAMIINYIKMDDIRGTWIESHFRWQLNTFWYGLLWSFLAFLTWIVLLGWFSGPLVTLWLIYRIAKGAIYLNDGKPVIF